MKSDFELQKAEKRAQFPCFEVMPSAITIIWPKKSRLRMLRSKRGIVLVEETSPVFVHVQGSMIFMSLMFNTRSARSKSQHRGSIDQIKKCISATLKSRTPDFQVPK